VLAAGSVGAQVFLELGAVLLGLALVGQLAIRLGVPAVPLYLLGGLAFGEGGVVSLRSPEGFIEIGAEIGVLLLLLMLGLEYSADELLGNLRANAPAGLVDVVLNALPGLVAGLLLGWSLPAALALAGVTYISSSGIVAKLLSDLGRLGNRETPVVLSLLVLEDLAMAVYLPVLGTLLAGVGLLVGGVTVAVALTAVGAILVLSLRFGAQVTRLVSSDDPENLLLRLLGITLLVAGAAQQTQVSAAVGAFLVGIALSGEVAEGARAILTPLRDLFAAVFFVFFGLQTDPGEIPGVALVALVLCVVTAADQAGHRLVRCRARRRRLARTHPRRDGARGARRVLDRHRRARGLGRGRAADRAAVGHLRALPGRRRAAARPGRRAAARRAGQPPPGVSSPGTGPALRGGPGPRRPVSGRAGAPAPAAPLHGLRGDISTPTCPTPAAAAEKCGTSLSGRSRGPRRAARGAVDARSPCARHGRQQQR